jgi:hypothetical protein
LPYKSGVRVKPPFCYSTTPFHIELEIYFKAENLVLRARSESVGFAEIVNKDRMVGTKAFMPFRVQRHRVKTKRLSLIIS